MRDSRRCALDLLLHAVARGGPGGVGGKARRDQDGIQPEGEPLRKSLAQSEDPRQGWALVEGIKADLGDALGDGDRSQGPAPAERVLADLLHTLGDGDAPTYPSYFAKTPFSITKSSTPIANPPMTRSLPAIPARTR